MQREKGAGGQGEAIGDDAIDAQVLALIQDVPRQLQHGKRNGKHIKLGGQVINVQVFALVQDVVEQLRHGKRKGKQTKLGGQAIKSCLVQNVASQVRGSGKNGQAVG